ncbi:MAG: ABC transporter ATP-binding protein [Candidatus Tectomicrobia bacterium]|uniref:ABC transporter ATP-binding protein n=1 Tax=Tectimicrobiota bacterium TaxID=2528274 RepID=A0A933GNH2_UNCTE|nr:ABC transporter ATP-binding protein [Candidatus Tectomicrobia bacterium]
MLALELDKVSYRYPLASSEALKNISLTLGERESLLLAGRTGAGKSTLTRIPNNILTQYFSGTLQGRTSVFGQDIKGKSVQELSSAVGLVFQDYEAQLFSTSVLKEVAFGPENLGLKREETKERIKDALERVGLTGFEKRDPATLSGGEKQRLAIASLLACRPKFVIMDEPTTDLDPDGRRRIVEISRTLQGEGATILVVSLDIEDWAFIKRTTILRAGELVFDNVMEKAWKDSDMLLKNGVRPSPIVELFNRLQIPLSSRTANHSDFSLPLLNQYGYKFSEESYETLLKKENPSSAIMSREIIGVNTLTFNYAGRTPALKNISLSIKEGDFLAIIGANGSGKTTLLKILKGIIASPANNVLYQGLPINRYNPFDLGAKIGFVFQNPDHQIFQKTLWDELIFGPKNYGWSDAKIYSGAYHLMELLGLIGLEHMDPALLTKGERQKLALASILIMNPEVLILDEPTTGLDYLEQREFMDLISEYHSEGHTTIIVTHALWVVAEYAWRALVMRQGEIIYDGSVRSLFASPQILESASLCIQELTKLGLETYGKVLLSVEEWMACLKKS